MKETFATSFLILVCTFSGVADGDPAAASADEKVNQTTVSSAAEDLARLREDLRPKPSELDILIGSRDEKAIRARLTLVQSQLASNRITLARIRETLDRTLADIKSRKEMKDLEQQVQGQEKTLTAKIDSVPGMVSMNTRWETLRKESTEIIARRQDAFSELAAAKRAKRNGDTSAELEEKIRTVERSLKEIDERVGQITQEEKSLSVEYRRQLSQVGQDDDECRQVKQEIQRLRDAFQTRIESAPEVAQGKKVYREELALEHELTLQQSRLQSALEDLEKRTEEIGTQSVETDRI